METSFTLEYWVDEGWYVGRLKELPGVMSQGRTVEELEANVWDAYCLFTEASRLQKEHFTLIRKQLGLK